MRDATIDSLPGLKERQLRAMATCAKCRRKVGAAGPILYRVRLEQIILDVVACQRQTGLALAIGSAQLAAVMGPDEDLAKVTMQREATLCGECIQEVGAIEVMVFGTELTP